MATIPRTDAFPSLVGGIPSDGAAYLLGDHIAVDKASDAYGEANRYGSRDAGVIWTDASKAAAAWLAYRGIGAEENEIITGKFFWRHVSGATRQSVSLGLMARLGNISSSSAGPPEHWYKADAYVFEAEIDPDAETADFYLRRVDQGVKTTLTSSLAVSWPEFRNYELELRCLSLSDGKVVLFAKLDGDNLLSAVDAVGSALTGAGHYGFLTSSGKAAAGETRASIRNFKAAALSDGSVWLDDDFDRPNRVGADDYYVRSFWSHTEAVTTAGGQISYGSESGIERVSMYQAVPTDEDYTVRADLTYPNTADAHWCGVVARGGKGSSGGDLDSFTGYLARLRIDTSTNNLELKKVINGAVIWTQQADVSGLSASTPIELKLDVSGSGDVTLKVYVDTVLKLTVTDQDANRLLQKGQSGIYLNRASGGSGALVADDFVLGDPPASASSFTRVAVADEDVGGITRYFVQGEDLTGQIDGATATFTLAQTPASAAETAVFRNGIRMERVASSPGENQYTVNTGAASITIGGTVPASGETLVIDYPLVGNTDLVIGEEPSGTKNGLNYIFTLASTPKRLEAIRVYLAGVRLSYVAAGNPGIGQFAVPNPTTIVVGLAPTSTTALVADYVSGGSLVIETPTYGEVPTGAIDGSNRVFELVAAPNSPAECAPAVNGVHLKYSAASPGAMEFSLVDKTITLGEAPPAGAEVRVDYVRSDLFELLFNYVPDYPFRAIDRFQTIKYGFEYGYEQSWPVRAQSRRRFECVFGNRDKAERDAIMSFIEARVGSHQQFSWVPPDETDPITVHLKGVSARASKTNPDNYSIHLVLEELITFTAAAA